MVQPDDEEDDYMSMVFEDAPKGPKYETSLQRAARKRKEVHLFAPMKAHRAENKHRVKLEHAKRPKPSVKQTKWQPEKHHLLLLCPRLTEDLR